MNSIYINRMPYEGPYGGGNMFIKACYQYFDKFGFKFSSNPDVMLCVGLDREGQMPSIEEMIQYRQQNHNVKLILRINENDARKNTNHVDKRILRVSEYIDSAIFVSNYMYDYFALNNLWKCKNNHVVINGCDSNIFKPYPKISNSKINLVTHHWSDNPLKGSDIYEKLDKFIEKDPQQKFSFTYIGRTKSKLPNSTIVKPIYGEELGKELGKYDIYVSASRFDPGPNHIIESLSCKLPTFVHQDGGGCVEFAGKDFVYKDFNHLLQLLNAENIKLNTWSLQPTSWETCIQELVQTFSF